MQVSGLYIGDAENIPSAQMVPLVGEVRRVIRSCGGFEEARRIIQSFPLTITFDEIIDYQREEDVAQGRKSTFEMKDAIARATEVAMRLNELGIQSEVVLPNREGVNKYVATMIKAIENGIRTHSHRVIQLEGETGCGKTAMIRQACEYAGIQKEEIGYFSLPTLAPEDFVGIPDPVRGEHGETTGNFRYLLLDGLNKYRVMILDETNRAHPKILNAVMQLMLEAQINGTKFEQLVAIFCAINVADEEGKGGNYVGTEEMDDAVRQRIHHFIPIQGKPDADILNMILKEKIQGLKTDDDIRETAEIGVEWWNGLSVEQKKAVNPRRLEFILQAHLLDEGLDYVMDRRDPRGAVTIAELQKQLAKMNVLNLRMLLEQTDEVEAILKDGGAKAHDITFRFQKLVKQMKARRMDKEFVSVAHLYQYVPRDYLPGPNRDKSLYHFVKNSISKYAGEQTAKEFMETLNERMLGAKNQQKQLKKISQTLGLNADDKSMKT